MSLQIRVRHGEIERVATLPPCAPYAALSVGSAKAAIISIDSSGIAPMHCALYVQGGQWAVQDLSGGHTWLNDEPMPKRAALRIGDVLTLAAGDDRTTLEVLSVARQSGPAVEEDPGEPAVAAADEAGLALPSAETDTIQWPTEPSVIGYRSGLGKRRKPPSQTPIIVAAVVAVVMVAGTALFLATRATAPVVVAAPPAPPAPPNSIFAAADPARVSAGQSGAGREPATPEEAPSGGDAAAAASSSSSSSDGSSSSDAAPPAPQDPAWADVESAHEMADQAQALLRFEDYRQQSPGKHEAELATFTEDALNLLWWQRVAQLVNKQHRLSDAISTKTKEINEETNPAFRQNLMKDKAGMDSELSQARQDLATEVGYDSDVPPDVNDSAALARLAQTRDPAKYQRWKVGTLKYIRLHHGEKPWAGDD